MLRYVTILRYDDTMTRYTIWLLQADRLEGEVEQLKTENDELKLIVTSLTAQVTELSGSVTTEEAIQQCKGQYIISTFYL